MKSVLLTFLTISFIFLSNPLSSQNALHFDGTNDRVDCGNPAALQITGTAITIEAWVKPSSFGPNNWSNNIVNKEEYGTSNGYTLRCGIGGRINFNIGSGGSTWNEITTSNVVLTANNWTHVAATYDGNYMKIYINGVVTDSIVKTISITNAVSTNLYLGDYSNSNRYYHGAIDEVRIWNVARTKAQIIANMNTEMCGGQAGLKGYYRLNEGIANSSNTGVTTAVSSAINGVNGTLSNFNLSGTTSNWVTGQGLTQTINYGGDTIYGTICQGDYYQFGSQTLTSAGTYLENFLTVAGCDSIITLILDVNQPNSINLFDTICQGEVYTLGSQQINQAGTYTEIFKNIYSCDSVVKLFLEMRTVSLSVSVISSGTALQCLATPAYYQWLDCDNNNAIIPGATNSIYVPTSVGNYSVIVTQNNCSDTTVCIPITKVVGIKDNSNILSVQVSPNPSTGTFRLSGLNDISPSTLYLYNSMGQEVFTQKIRQKDYELNLQNFVSGIYYLQVNNGNNQVRLKIVKQ